MRRGDRLPVGHRPRVVLDRKQHRWWLRARRRGLTATDVPSLMGANPYATPLSVWMDKTGHTDPEDLSGNYAVARGNHMEPMLLAWWESASPGRSLLHTPALIAHPEHTWLMCSLDGLGTDSDGTLVIETKTAGWRAREPWWDDTTLIPDGYALQVLTQLAVTGLPRAHVVADVAGEFTERVIERDTDWEAVVLPALHTWWVTHVQGQTAPPADPVADWPLLNRLWVTEPGTERDATPDEIRLLTQWRDAKTEAGYWGDVTKSLRGEIRVALEHHQRLTLPDDGRPLASLDAGGALRAGPALAELHTNTNERGTVL